MTRLKVLPIVSIIVVQSLVACGSGAQKKEVSRVSENTLQMIDPKSDLTIKTLLGTWQMCQAMDINQDESANFGVLNPMQSALIELTFAPDGAGKIDYQFYSGKNCEKVFTAENYKDYVDELYEKCREKAGGELCAALKEAEIPDLARQYLFSYRASEVAAAGVGDLDITTAVDDEHPEKLVTTYVSYRWLGEDLEISNGCDQEQVDDGECKPLSGDAPERRATDFTNSSRLAPKLEK